MINQFGQDIRVGNWVGYVSKTGSFTHRKVGVVIGFGDRRSEITVHVDWKFDGSSAGLRARPIDRQGKGGVVGITRLLKLVPEPHWYALQEGK